MNTSNSHFAPYGRYIGRVGALAASLGIGVMLVTSPGVAGASPSSPSTTLTDSSTSQSSTGDGSQTGAAGVDATTPANPSNGDGSPAGDGSTAAKGSTTSVDTTASGSTSSRMRVAPGVTISANSIKIGSRTITLGIGALKPPTGATSTGDADGVASQPESEQPLSSEGPTPEVSPVTETSQTTSTLAKNEPKSTHPVIASAATSLLAHAPSKTVTEGSAVDKVGTFVTQLRATVTEQTAARAGQASEVSTASNAITAPAVAAAVAPVTPTAQAAQTGAGVVGLFNVVVTNLLKPFLTPAPSTPGPVSPVAWAVLGWVRRNLFNQSPTIYANPATTQTGQTVTGRLAADPEGDRLTYTVIQAPANGTVEIDAATDTFTFTPDDINYDGPQEYSFRVAATDGKFNLLSPFSAHGDVETVTVTVQPPTAERVILQMPEDITKPVNPRFSEDGESVFFSGTPTEGGRAEIYRMYDISADGAGTVECMTCGVAVPAGVPENTNLGKPVPFTDGSGRILVRVGDQGSVASGSWAVLEQDADGTRRLVPIETPESAAGTVVITPQREMRISPDGQHVAFSQLVMNNVVNDPNRGYVGINAVVGELVDQGDKYVIKDPVVIYDIGEVKQFTPDGQGVVILGGQYEIGNLDDVVVNLDDGTVTRVTANLDYDEDMDYSPDQKWIAIGSTRTLDALTPMTQIVRPGFLLPNIYGVVYEFYADPVNLSNQEWLVAAEDELERENGIPLFVVDDPSTTDVDEGDDYTARSMPSWNPTGDAVTFWESNVDNPTDSRVVIANLKYTTSGPAENPDPVTPNYRDWGAESLSSYVPSPPQAPFGPRDEPYIGAGGRGTATVRESAGPSIPQLGPTTVRTVVYDDYVNEDGLVLNGWESTTTTGNQYFIGYNADITVTDAVSGEERGYLTGNARIVTTATGQAYSGGITSVLDGKTLTLMDEERLADAVQNA